MRESAESCLLLPLLLLTMRFPTKPKCKKDFKTEAKWQPHLLTKCFKMPQRCTLDSNETGLPGQCRGVVAHGSSARKVHEKQVHSRTDGRMMRHRCGHVSGQWCSLLGRN